jgi:hypothetical protein
MTTRRRYGELFLFNRVEQHRRRRAAGGHQRARVLIMQAGDYLDTALVFAGIITIALAA